MIHGTPMTQTEHLIQPDLLERPVKVLVVGCGGTGSAIATGLPHLHQAMLALGHPGGLHVTLADGDVISETNCVRQPFVLNEVGHYKASVLATRINLFWGLDWRAINEYVNESWSLSCDIIIGCVDTRLARHRLMGSESMMYQAKYWLDCGNNADSGQFVLGEPSGRLRKDDKLRLPTVAELLPEIVDTRLDRKDRLPSCSAVEALEKQEPFVNQTLAYHALALLARLFRYGRLTCHGGFINLATGRMSALNVDPAIWQSLSDRQRAPRHKGKARARRSHR